MAEVITWIPGPAWVQETLLDGRNYQIRAAWNDAYEFWSMDILTESGTLIVAGLKLVPNWELIRRYRDDRLPKGYLMAVTVADNIERIGYTDLLDGKVLLIYESV